MEPTNRTYAVPPPLDTRSIHNPECCRRCGPPPVPAMTTRPDPFDDNKVLVTVNATLRLFASDIQDMSELAKRHPSFTPEQVLGVVFSEGLRALRQAR